RELRKDVDPHEVVVNAIEVDPLLHLRLVRHSGAARIDIERLPQPGALAARETLPEIAGSAGRVAQQQPDTLGVLIREEALLSRKDYIRCRRGLIVDRDRALAGIVEAAHRLWIGLLPSEGIEGPILPMLRVDRDKRACLEFEPLPKQRYAVPLG